MLFLIYAGTVFADPTFYFHCKAVVGRESGGHSAGAQKGRQEQNGILRVCVMNGRTPKPIGRHALIRGAGEGSGTRRVPPVKQEKKSGESRALPDQIQAGSRFRETNPFSKKALSGTCLKLMCLFLKARSKNVRIYWNLGNHEAGVAAKTGFYTK